MINAIYIHLCSPFIFLTFFLRVLGSEHGINTNQINSILDNAHACFKSVCVYDPEVEQMLFDLNTQVYCMPASNQKLLTAAAALHLLDKNFTFKTVLFLDGHLDNDILYGDIYLKTDGDPLFMSDHFLGLLNSLQEREIRTIKGNFYIDDTVFDSCAFAPGTTIDDLGQSYYQPIRGFMVNKKAAIVCPTTKIDFLDYNAPIQELYIDACQLVRLMCAMKSIKINGLILSRQTPVSANVLKTHCSLPLTAILKECLKNSDNTIADCVYKKMGQVYASAPGSWRSGSDAIKSFLQKIPINGDNMRIVDGSGLSHYNLVRPIDIMQLLNWIYHQDDKCIFIEMLPIGSVDGTLSNRMKNCKGQIYAKTGTTGKTSALSGFIKPFSEKVLIVVMFFNNCFAPMTPTMIKNTVEDQICSLLANNI